MAFAHHALLYRGDWEDVFGVLPGEATQPGADVLHFRGARMGIDDVRALTSEAYRTPLTDVAVRTFVLAYGDYTVEAQNALLKLLEEPPRTATFHFIAPRTMRIAPTLASRMVEVAVARTGERGYEDFFSSALADRLALIARKATDKDDTWLRGLMDALEEHAATTKNRELMRALLDLRPSFGLTGASKKMILEHLTLFL